MPYIVLYIILLLALLVNFFLKPLLYTTLMNLLPVTLIFLSNAGIHLNIDLFNIFYSTSTTRALVRNRPLIVLITGHNLSRKSSSYYLILLFSPICIFEHNF